MSSSSPAPKLPIWIFLATDAVLLVAAAYIADRAPRPLPDTATLAVVACVLAGAIIGLVPLVAYYERQKNETLDERQRALEALARTLESSAEQISIAASGMHEIAEIAQRNLKHAELLPQRLQEKMAEFQAQLANASDSEKEELEKEVEELRASETERLQTTFDRIARTAGEFAKLEASIQKQVDAANEAVAKLSARLAAAAAKIEQSTAPAAAPAMRAPEPPIAPAAPAKVEPVVAEAKPAEPANADAAASAASPKRSRKPRREETPVAAVAAAALPERGHDTTSPHGDTATPASDRAAGGNPAAVEDRGDHNSAAAAAAEPSTPAVAESKPDHAAADATPVPPAPALAAVAPHASEAPKSNGSTAHDVPTAPSANGTTAPAAPEAAPVLDAPEPAPKPARKRAARKPEDDQPGLGLDLGESDAAAPAAIERVISSDGATRLIVTAYIGIGNRLFIRGSGPGLSWDKGIPLQFVSIGKWRWETNDASTPVQLKLLKNDAQESVGLGALTIDPGHQHEVTATFN